MKRCAKIFSAVLISLVVAGLILEFSPDKKVVGVDISHNNDLNADDWAKIGEEAEFLYLKVSEGGTYKDPMRLKNYRKAKKHSLHVGAYHFFRDNVDAKKQFDNFKDAVKDIPELTLIPCIDYEKDGFRVGLKERINNLRELNELFTQEYGHPPVIYCNLLDYATVKGFCPDNPYWICFNSPALGVGIIKQEQREINGKVIDFNKLTSIEDILLH